MLSVKSILWPFDGSEASKEALDTAIVVAKQFKAKIYGLHVVDSLPKLLITGYGDLITKDGDAEIADFNLPLYEMKLRQSAWKSLQQTVSERVPEGIEVETKLETGVPKDTIADYAKDRGIDLIIMSTRGRSGLSRMMLGSVTDATIRTSEVPILLIPVET